MRVIKESGVANQPPSKVFATPTKPLAEPGEHIVHRKKLFCKYILQQLLAIRSQHALLVGGVV